jgi:hypothetical protein
VRNEEEALESVPVVIGTLRAFLEFNIDKAICILT